MDAPKPACILILSFDPGAQDTGWSVFKYNIDTKVSQPLKFGIIPTNAATPMDRRVFFIVKKVGEIIDGLDINEDNRLLVVMEEPPQTLYGQKNMPKNSLVGRATSMFKVFGVLYAITTELRRRDVRYRLVFPNQWQATSKEREKVDTKVWSKQEAKSLLSKLCKALPSKRLLKDHNFCDAVNICWYACMKLKSGEWEYQIDSREAVRVS